MPNVDYQSDLTGQQMDDALHDLNNHTTLYGAEAWARGTKGGVDVGSTDPTYHNNARYYAEVAQSAVPVGAEGALLWNQAMNLSGLEKDQARNNADIKDYQIAFDGFVSPTINGIRNYWDGSLYHRRIARVDLGSLAWSTTSGAFYTAISNCKVASSLIALYCTKYSNIEVISSNSDISSKPDKSILYKKNSPSGNQINIKDSAYATIADFKTAMSGVFLYYELATEQTLNIDKNGLRYELLWTNASPTSAFPNNTSSPIALKLSNYKFVIVVFKGGTSYQDWEESFCIKIGVSANPSGIVSNKLSRRPTYTTATTISFGSGGRYDSYGTVVSDDTIYIPYQIYGIR